MLSLFNNEKFRKFIRIFLIVTNFVFFIGVAVIGMRPLIALADPDGHDPLLESMLFLLKDVLVFPLWVALAAYAFALRSYDKKQFVVRATIISLSMIVFLFLIELCLFRFLPFDDLLFIGSMYILVASVFWGLIGLCLPKHCFLTSEPTKKTFVLRKIFYGLLLFTYVAFIIYLMFR